MYGTCGRIDNKADFDFDFDFDPKFYTLVHLTVLCLVALLQKILTQTFS